ncbi:complex I subunit 4 family protein [Aciditerrimonas ferrireducens]|uniref:complex I subunit 4 family protein n=1 Tax=Aciditerrimonas ferrireducens TaxID=667306 RepID=UPI002002B4F2|nr:NADH-quinone oxidoreductase subunit M [Aciditerrimonas ferrireducens]MCK4176913.1 NADH-quinone oxidoreductase subunit M [Aciditerrimonas ferrireducens]
MSQPVFPFLTTLVFLPVGGAVAAMAAPRLVQPAHRRPVAILVGALAMTATLAVALAMAVEFRVGDSGYQFVSAHEWIPALGISWQLGVDGISLFLVLMAAVLFPLALLGARESERAPSYVAWLLLLEAACLGSFVALDLVLFFLFFEITLVPAYFVIAGWGTGRRAAAATKFFLYTFLGSAFLLVGIVAVAVIHDQQTGRFTFDLLALEHTRLGLSTQVLLFLAFTAAFAVKAPIFPFHTWSPDAYGSSPTGGAVALAAVMAKLGTYGVIRFDLTLFPRAVVDAAPVLLSLGVAGILYGAIVAAVQRDLKRILAYSSLAHIGFIVLGLFALSTEAVTGGVLQMVNHGLVTAALFLLVGWVWERRGTVDAGRLRGLQRSAPVLAGFFTLAMMASIGLPGLNSFVGEFLVLSGTFLTHRWWAVVATFGVVLAAVYLLWAFQRAFHHRPTPETSQTKDLRWGEIAVMVPLAGLIVFLGVYPKPVLDRITPSVEALVHQVDQATGRHQPAVANGGVAAVTAAGRRTPAAASTAGVPVVTAAALGPARAGGPLDLALPPFPEQRRLP